MTATEVEPGIYPDMTDAEYFALPALSHSDCKLLLDSPARYRWAKDNPRSSEPTEDMIFGSAVHSLVLGGPAVVCIDADNWRTKAAKEARDEAESAGGFPLLAHRYEQAADCAASLMAHPLAGKMLAKLDHAEVVCVWERDGVLMRSKLDGVVAKYGLDVKTTGRAHTDDFGRSAATFGYATQQAFYEEAMRECLGITDPEFLFLAVEKQPPYLVNVIRIDPYDVDLAAKDNELAVQLFKRCTEANDWPGYPTGINETTLPRWWQMERENL